MKTLAVVCFLAILLSNRPAAGLGVFDSSSKLGATMAGVARFACGVMQPQNNVNSVGCYCSANGNAWSGATVQLAGVPYPNSGVYLHPGATNTAYANLVTNSLQAQSDIIERYTLTCNGGRMNIRSWGTVNADHKGSISPIMAAFGVGSDPLLFFAQAGTVFQTSFGQAGQGPQGPVSFISAAEGWSQPSIGVSASDLSGTDMILVFPRGQSAMHIFLHSGGWFQLQSPPNGQGFPNNYWPASGAGVGRSITIAGTPAWTDNKVSGTALQSSTWIRWEPYLMGNFDTTTGCSIGDSILARGSILAIT